MTKLLRGAARLWHSLPRLVASAPAEARRKPYSNAEVIDHYEAYTDTYVRATGDFIQAYRTADTDALMAYLVSGMQLRDGMAVLDAGCGVGAPAIWIARHFPGISITSITNSPKQFAMASERIAAAGLERRISLVLGDYHSLPEYCGASTFDLVMFLESLGHANDLAAVLDGARHVLKPGGNVYVKDFFGRHSRDATTQSKIDEVIDVINRNYCYNVMSLPGLIQKLTESGLGLKYVRSPLMEADVGITVLFEDLSGLLTYPAFSKTRSVDWYEILATRD